MTRPPLHLPANTPLLRGNKPHRHIETPALPPALRVVSRREPGRIDAFLTRHQRAIDNAILMLAGFLVGVLWMDWWAPR